MTTTDGTDTCLSCNLCVVLKPRRKKKSFVHPCPVKLHPSEPEKPGRLFKLFDILRSITPKDIWYTVRRRPGYNKISHHRPEPIALPSTKISVTPPLLTMVRAKFRELGFTKHIRSESPVKTLIAHHGTDVLLAPIRDPEFKKFNSLADLSELERLEQQRNAKLLASQRGLCVGGIENRLSTLKNLKPIEPSDELKELEPLRAMSLQEVTNISLLIEASGSDEEEE